MAVLLCKGLFQVKPCLDGQDVNKCDIALSATSIAPISSALCVVDHTFFLSSNFVYTDTVPLFGLILCLDYHFLLVTGVLVYGYD